MKPGFLSPILAVLLVSRLAAGSATTPPAPSDREFRFPTTGVSVNGRALLLAIDDYLLPQRENVCLYLTKPRCRAEPVVTPEFDDPLAPDQVGTSFYGTVLHDGDRFRMWYYAIRLNEPGDARHSDMKNTQQGPVCYAESDDGITWRKPKLGQVEIRGSTANNAIRLPDASTQAAFIIKDPGDPDPGRRYKMAYNAHTGDAFHYGVTGAPQTGTWVTRTAVSGDGVHWKAASDYSTDQFIEIASFYRFNGYYIVNGHRLLRSEGGHASGRQGHAIRSIDFDGRWIPGDVAAFLLPEPADPARRGQAGEYDQVHLGVGAAPFGNVVVGLYGIWHNRAGDFDPEKRWGWFGYGRTSGDLGLVVSNDGLHFREPVAGHVFISRHDSPATPVSGKQFPTVLCQSGNAILNVGDETRIYFGRWTNAGYNQGYTVEVALATLPRDRWGAVGLFPKVDPMSGPDRPGPRPGPRDDPAAVYEDHGSVWSAPIQIPADGFSISVNADHTSGMSVEISDERFRLLPEFSGANAGAPQQESGLDCSVRWPAANPSALGGRTIRLKISLAGQKGEATRLYGLCLEAL